LIRLQGTCAKEPDVSTCDHGCRGGTR
jgi:hypothetical protein